MYEKILVATMGDYLEEISKHTLGLVEEKECELIGIYVVDTSVPFLTPSKVKEMMKKELNERGKNVINKLEAKLKTPNSTFKGIIVEGDPASEIIKTAEKEDVDMIVVGTGKSKIDKHLLGSVTEKIVHSAPCTVLLVKTYQ